MSAQVIMLASGKGGTGKSTVSVLLGAALAARTNRVLLVELDSGLRSVDVIAGVCGKTVYDVEDVLCGRCEPGKAVVESPLYKDLYVISAPYSGGHISQPALRVLTDAMRPVFDFILIDTAAGIGAPFQAASGVCDEAVLGPHARPRRPARRPYRRRRTVRLRMPAHASHHQPRAAHAGRNGHRGP